MDTVSVLEVLEATQVVMDPVLVVLEVETPIQPQDKIVMDHQGRVSHILKNESFRNAKNMNRLFYNTNLHLILFYCYFRYY